MGNFSLYLPDNILKDLDASRKISRSKAIRLMVISCLSSPGYIADLK